MLAVRKKRVEKCRWSVIEWRIYLALLHPKEQQGGTGYQSWRYLCAVLGICECRIASNLCQPLDCRRGAVHGSYASLRIRQRSERSPETILRMLLQLEAIFFSRLYSPEWCVEKNEQVQTETSYCSELWGLDLAPFGMRRRDSKCSKNDVACSRSSVRHTTKSRLHSNKRVSVFNCSSTIESL
jgi:hypothetical protein